MDQLIAFVQDRWIVIALAIVGMIIIVKVVKSIVKWVIILIVAAALILYGTNYAGSMKEIGAKIADYTKEEVVNALLGESSNATYSSNEDGTYTVTTEHFTLEGEEGSSEVQVTYKGQSITIELDNALRAFIQEAQSSQAEN